MLMRMASQWRTFQRLAEHLVFNEAPKLIRQLQSPNGVQRTIQQGLKLGFEVLVATARDLRPLREAGIHDGFQRELERLLAASALRVDRVAQHIQRRIG